MIISEIFKSIDGESKRAGQLATFIRSVGCNLRCSFCDSQYTWKRDETSRDMTIMDIVNKCEELGCRNITFTGGEPLIQNDADDLIKTLSAIGKYDISIETDGAVDFTSRDWFINNLDNVWVCADYKCYTSSQTEKMLPLDTFCKLRDRDVLKFVVGSEKDLNQAKEIISYLRDHNCNCFIYLSPVFGDIEPVDIVNFMLENNLQDKINFQLQLHKLVWDPNMRGV